MAKRTIRQLRRSVGIPAAALVMCAALATGCSHDEGFDADDGNPVAVNFTASVDGAATPQYSALGGGTRADGTGMGTGTRAGVQEFTGTTPAGVPYRDFTDKDGFETRAFYPGAASSNNLTRGANAPSTRTTGGGDEWTPTDRIGVFMLKEGGSMPTATDLLADNAELEPTSINTNTASLTPTGGTIYYPQSGNVDFVAYYPYTSAIGTNPGQITGNDYYLTVAGQTDEAAQNDLDVLYSNNATDVTKSRTAPVGLTFDHVLSKVTLNVTAGEGIDATAISGLDASAVSFNGMPLTATLDLQDGSLTAGTAGAFSPVKAATATSPANATFTALLVPQPQDGGATSAGLPDVSGRTVVFTVGGIDYTWTILDTEVFAAGNHYTYPLTVQKSGVVIAGDPTITDWNVGAPHDPGQAEILAVRIPAGKFLMGSSNGRNYPTYTEGDPDLNTTPSEPNRYGDETQHKVTLTENFYMNKYPVTNAQYAAFLNSKVIGSDGKGEVTYSVDGNSTTGDETFVSTHNWGVKWDTDKWVVSTAGYDDYPVINVTWYGATAYAEWMSEQTGMHWQLPTEAQWEYACRGGIENRPFGIGNGYELNNTLANFDWNQSWSWDGTSASASITNTGTYPGTTQAVGNYVPNVYGLYDMHGNVFEWCQDQWNGSDNYLSLTDTDPLSTTGNFRVLRGGSWYFNAQYCRSASRDYYYPDYASLHFGFRVVFVP